jgi:uncharacterized membrane protein YhaH (DUF805 family)/uncharacterized protein YndB with AHSA1/START domain
MNILRRVGRWFSLQGTVSREEYLLTGLGLMLFKYGVEEWTIAHYTNQFYSPLAFVNPLLSVRSQLIQGAPDWLGMVWVLWTVPFVWIALTMSVRRAIDADASPWLGLLVLVPVLNLIFMLWLAAIRRPEGIAPDSVQVVDDSDYAAGDSPEKASIVSAALAGIAAGMMFFLGMTMLGIYVFGSYGVAVFVGTPVTSTAVSAYFFNRSQGRSVAATLGHSLLVMLASAGFLLAFGLEGGVCILMALPLVLPVAFLGAILGQSIALERHITRRRKDRGVMGCVLVLPILAGAETIVAPQTEFEVLSVAEIAAPPERVWECVVSFPKITERPEWFFRTGISCPIGARIKGAGVGAMRYCDFTTGSFVEPVTAWQPAKLLAFDVTEQPDPMTELSPYRHIHPPHLDGSFRSTRGEFRLVPLADGTTRLEGRTWYKLDIYPHAYWTLWSDWLIHKIHGRVLKQIKQLAESGQA